MVDLIDGKICNKCTVNIFLRDIETSTYFNANFSYFII